jgi:hypothetical protein
MRIEWTIESEDIEAIHDLSIRMQDNPLVKDRVARNIEGTRRPSLTRSVLWHAIVTCLLTTQQRSGPSSSVNAMITRKPFPLNLTACQKALSPRRFVQDQIEDHGGIRRGPTIARECEHNLAWLSEGGWSTILNRFQQLERQSSKRLERESARFVNDHLTGFGPKQSRNLLQMLGLTRWETPLDSRIIKWLNSHGFPIHLTSGSLSDPAYYEFVMDGIQMMCQKADTFPCILDAMIFASFDGDSWTETNLLW